MSTLTATTSFSHPYLAILGTVPKRFAIFGLTVLLLTACTSASSTDSSLSLAPTASTSTEKVQTFSHLVIENGSYGNVPPKD